MMEKLGQAKTHLELKKMIAEVDTNNSGEDYFYFTCACYLRLEEELGGREGEVEERERERIIFFYMLCDYCLQAPFITMSS